MLSLAMRPGGGKVYERTELRDSKTFVFIDPLSKIFVRLLKFTRMPESA